MHMWAKDIMECLKDKVDEIGLDNVSKCDLDELGKWTDIAKDIAEYDYYYNVIEAMENSEYGKDYDYKGRYPEHGSGEEEHKDASIIIQMLEEEIKDRRPMMSPNEITTMRNKLSVLNNMLM